MPKISVIVLSFNTKDKLRRCLSCLERTHEVLVIDNASSDGSPEMVRREFPHVLLVENSKNVGFGVANNQGSELATGDLHLYLNSDAYAEAGAIDRLATVFEDAKVVAAGGRLLNMDGSLQTSTSGELTLWAVFCEQTYLEKLFPKATFFNSYWTTERRAGETEPWETPQVMGASLMVRAPNSEPMEWFDPRYFLYCEDTDLCLRLRRRGRIMYVPEARFTHELGSSSAKDPSVGIVRYNLGKELYFRIHHGRLAQSVCFLLNQTGAGLRLIVWCVIAGVRLGRDTRANQQIHNFWRVMFTLRRSPSVSPRIPG